MYTNVFSSDAGKATGNRKKHAVTFEEAATVLSHAEGLDWDDFEHSDSNERSVRLGFSAAGRVFFVVYTIRGSNMAKKQFASSASGRRHVKLHGFLRNFAAWLPNKQNPIRP